MGIMDFHEPMDFGAGISGNCRESEALPSGTQVAARREVLTIRLLVVDWVGAKWGFLQLEPPDDNFKTGRSMERVAPSGDVGNLVEAYGWVARIG
ncbi:hypothetical protein DEO72_LG11g1913 [Vigna unguiculata]|uniref:Uncharacterized protein n=1 Tax=Vigna unguiculata TaxID=3917 RepID=A0A4D6NT23_VIGUN|nr:hypothetical protein DEO72_LG11g1913 [Vigna unguiculata]